MAVADVPLSSGFSLKRLWQRDLDSYPPNRQRYFYLTIVVLVTVVLYYENYVGGSVSTKIFVSLNMSFTYYVTLIIVSSALGAVSSLAAGLADKVGRANLIVYGTFFTSFLDLLAIPHVHTKHAAVVVLCIHGAVEGVVLVATPALVRDFSPQVGRAAAMGFWTMGPVLGSLMVSEVSSHTLNHLHAWQDQYVIAGAVGTVVATFALFTLRELNAGIRDQIMVSVAQHTEIELRARGMDVEAATRSRFKQMVKPDIILSAVAISLFLMGYYTAVGFFPIYFQTVFNFTAAQSNSLLNWYWSFNALSLVMFGVLSDRLGVRKPFMLVGAVMGTVVGIVFISKTSVHNPSFSSIAVLLVFTGIWGGAAFATWMASFTETVERRNPALIATGIGLWGGVLRSIVAISFLILPHVVDSVTPLVNDGASVQAVDTQLGIKYPQLAVELQAHPDVFAGLAKYPPNAIPNSVLSHALVTVGSPALTEATQPGAKPLLAFLAKYAPGVTSAQARAPHQWRHWLIVCLAGQIIFIPMIWLMAGYWRPRRAREELERKEQSFLATAAVVEPVS
jgi:MFS family permease